jgi:hypothetical protein
MTSSLWGYLTTVAFVAELVFAALALVFVRRLLRHPPTPVSIEIRSVKTVLTKVRKGEPMTTDELDFATQTIADRGAILAYSVPAALFTVGCLYVFGSLQQLHGHAPSLRTYIGVLPMLWAANITIQLLRIATLKRRLSNVSETSPSVAR